MRYIMDIGTLWETSSTCRVCEAIDQRLRKLMTMNPVDYQARLRELEKLLVNGYGVVDVLEANAKTDDVVTGRLRRISSMTDEAMTKFRTLYGEVSATYDVTAAKQATAVFGRWCSHCGARKPDVVNTAMLRELGRPYMNHRVNGREVTVRWWLTIGYPLPWRAEIRRLVDDELDETVYPVNSLDDALTEVVTRDGRVYDYTLVVLDEADEEIFRRTEHVLVPCDVDHTPPVVTNLRFVRHRYLEPTEDGFVSRNYVRAVYDRPTDEDFGELVLKLNDDHVPSVDHWAKDLVFMDDRLTEFDRSTTYFLKPMVRSRMFNRDGVDDHDPFPDHFFWNLSMPARMFRYVDFADDMYNLEFEDGRRSVTIYYSLRVRNKLRCVRIMFKQTDRWITDDDDGTYKVVDVPAEYAIYDYRVRITGLTANAVWTFGVFPVYEDSDADVRLEYQHQVRVRPWFPAGEVSVGVDDFYHVGRWRCDADYGAIGHDGARLSIGYGETRDHQVMVCDDLARGEESALLVHDENVGDCVVLNFDYKEFTMGRDDSLNCFHEYTDGRFHRIMSTRDTSGRWLSYQTLIPNVDFLLIHWEQMRMGIEPYAATFVDNVRYHSLQVVDLAIDNFDRYDEIQFKEYYYYNRKIRHNAVYQHVPKKFYNVDVKIRPYFNTDGTVVDAKGVTVDGLTTG